MANYSTTEITIKKNSLQNEQIALDNFELFIKEFESFTEEDNWINASRLIKNDTPNEIAKYSTATILNQIKSNSILIMSLEGTWCSPSQLFIDLCKKYKLNLEYIDRENGCNFTHIVIIENGKTKLNRQSEYISALSIKHCKDEVFDEIIERFEDTEYYDAQEGISKFLNDEDYEYLKKELVSAKEYKNFLKYTKDYYARP